MSERTSGVPALTEAFRVDPSDVRLDSEHALSLQIAAVLDALWKLSIYVDGDKEVMSDEEATQLRVLVEDTYFSHIAPNRPVYDDNDDEDGYENPLERQMEEIQEYLRQIWWKEYFEPRTRPATPQDFQRWLSGYVDRYGTRALAKTTRVSSTFASVYHTFHSSESGEYPIGGGLRTATSDVMLIPAYGSKGLSIIEDENITVNRALPGAFDHHNVYSLNTDPDQLIGSIRIPSDIFRPPAKP